MILCKEQYAKKIDSAVFPGQQGGPLQHVIAAKAVALKIAASQQFVERQQRTLDGAQALGRVLLDAGSDSSGRLSVLTGGTDVHLLLVDLRNLAGELSGRDAEDRLHEIGITVNRNAVPFDPRPPMEASGLRVGTPALATRGLADEDFTEVAHVMATALLCEDFPAQIGELSARVQAIVERYPLYPALSTGAAAAALTA
jgi:glycine hydroxymethyltransferase